MSDEDKSYDERRSELPAELTISITRAELDRVAKKVGLDDGRVLYAMLVAPSAAGDINDYRNCVVHCSNLFEGDALVACIEGCAKVSSSFTAATVGPATRS
ncbi:hypothetical protein [Salinigranum sp. GCM10025319]|uniref:hypothetical protein n=1 Tax=Salinigranum sp. GCM10025319 TaxID=3252687 RepID=UPI0036205CA6